MTPLRRVRCHVGNSPRRGVSGEQHLRLPSRVAMHRREVRHQVGQQPAVFDGAPSRRPPHYQYRPRWLGHLGNRTLRTDTARRGRRSSGGRDSRRSASRRSRGCSRSREVSFVGCETSTATTNPIARTTNTAATATTARRPRRCACSTTVGYGSITRAGADACSRNVSASSSANFRPRTFSTSAPTLGSASRIVRSSAQRDGAEDVKPARRSKRFRDARARPISVTRPKDPRIRAEPGAADSSAARLSTRSGAGRRLRPRRRPALSSDSTWLSAGATGRRNAS